MTAALRRAIVVPLALLALAWASAVIAQPKPAAAPPAAVPPKPAATPPAAAAPPATPASDSCVACHVETGDDRLMAPVKAYAQDIHKAKGFGCVACHGGDPKEGGMEAMDPAKGFIGKPKREQIPQVCGRCHADARFMKQYNPGLRVDQVAEYATSIHGRRLNELKDPKVATCASCHPAHAIRPKSDPQSTVHPLRVASTCGRCHANASYMAEYKIPTDQLDKYTHSVHWQMMSVKGDLSAPTCNSCHGNHGAAPPGVSWVGNVCGQCHTVMADLFAKSVHARVFKDLGIPGCSACHQHHDVQPAAGMIVGLEDKAVCKRCHTANDAGGRAAVEIRGALDRLRGGQAAAAAVLERAEHAGMEVSQARFDLKDANDALVKARTAIHAFSVPAVKTEVDAGLAVAGKAQARGVRALEEFAFRRKGLGVSLVVIVALIAGLVVKIRQLERKPASRDAGATHGGA
ncbi:MAG TPA: multiheme c-type cytochrome [Candidatus Binatia bacterium]|nr:multiheme c-type cytochrome [Candidatus Binatia bacterium]